MTVYFILWCLVLVIAVIVEALTLQLVSVWFAAGAAGALLGVGLNLPFFWQMVIFTVVSAILFAVTRPLLKKIKVQDKLPNNLEAETGKLATVISPVSNEQNTGRVRIGGVDWKARSFDGQSFAVGEKVCVEKISGTTAYVSAKENVAFFNNKEGH